MSYCTDIANAHDQFQAGKTTLTEFRQFLDTVDAVSDTQDGYPAFFAEKVEQFMRQDYHN
jgi:hypothetical protein